ncbi:MAG: OmpA family protein [Betaproteobacteria bacterium]|nr:OmpA family protein [Betaproteobacteria bacterium]
MKSARSSRRRRGLALAGEPGQVEIRGHTDAAGNAENNRALSLRRAQAVRDAFVRMACPGAPDGRRGRRPGRACRRQRHCPRGAPGTAASRSACCAEGYRGGLTCSFANGSRLPLLH